MTSRTSPREVSDVLADVGRSVVRAGWRLGVGGIARAFDRALPVPSELIYAQYPRLGARGALVARSFFREPLSSESLAREVAAARHRLDEWYSAPVSMKVHLHTLCWNDRRMLDYFFRHYDSWIDRFYLLDDGSTDGTREYLEAHLRVTVEPLARVHPDSWVQSAQHVYDNAWKRSKGEADWVVVTNIDEHLFHPNILAYLARSAEAGVSAIPALGYQMNAQEFPPADAMLARDLRVGMPWRQMNRLGIFRPDHIEETRFTPGRHRAHFVGDVRYPEREEMLNLHYKYLGLDYTSGRHAELFTGLRASDVERGWGHKYSWSDAQLRDDFANVLAACVDVMDPATDHEALHAEGRWWR